MLNLDASIFVLINTNRYYVGLSLLTIVFVKRVDLSYSSEMFHLHMGSKHGNKGASCQT